jgi:peptidoglycan/LPS O-acetylase OafA/YrhL
MFLKGSTLKIGSRGRFAIVSAAFLLLFMTDFVFGPNQLDDLSSTGRTFPEFLLIGLGTTLLLAGFLGSSALGEIRILRYLGKISYGLYMFHVPCLWIVGEIVPRVLKTCVPLVIGLAGLLGTIAVASISYRYLETPFLRMKERFEIVKSRAV